MKTEQSLDIGIANIITNEWLRNERVKQTRECMLEVLTNALVPDGLLRRHEDKRDYDHKGRYD